MKSVTTRVLATLLAALPIACAASTDRPEGALAKTAASSVTLTAPDGRSVDLTVVAPAHAHGVILFSHGAGSSPGVTRALFESWAAKGFAVLAPTHTDSLTVPAERRTPFQAALATRVVDMKLAAAHAGKIWPRLPLAEVGYSYGSLIALMGGGAVSSVIPGSVPGVKAVVMFSSPGPIPPLTSAPGAFAKVTAPTLLVTGTADIVPGFVTEPSRHLVYFDGLPAGDRTALVVKDATHEFIRGNQPGWNEVAQLVADFLASRVLGDASAGERFGAAKSSARVEVRRR